MSCSAEDRERYLTSHRDLKSMPSVPVPVPTPVATKEVPAVLLGVVNQGLEWDEIMRINVF